MTRRTPSDIAHQLGSGLLSFPVTHFADDFSFDALIGDAFGVGPHWYYDVAETEASTTGMWITGYTDPNRIVTTPALKAGQLSQSGLILDNDCCARSLESGGYDEADFCRRMDDELFPQLDGQPDDRSGRLHQPVDPRSVASARCNKDCRGANRPVTPTPPKPFERTLALAVRYAESSAPTCRDGLPQRRAHAGRRHGAVAMTVAYGALLGSARAGPINSTPVLSDKLMHLVESRRTALPCRHAATTSSHRAAAIQTHRVRDASPRQTPCSRHPTWPRPRCDPGIRIEPAWKVSIVYGMPCAIYHQLPDCLLSRRAVPRRLRVGRAARAEWRRTKPGSRILTGALVGAQVGLSGIPKRFLDGLENGSDLTALALRLGEQVEASGQ